MAISVTNIGTANGATGATLAIAVPAGGVPLGSLIIFGACEANTTGIGGSVADTLNTYTSTTGVLNNNASAQGFGRMWYVPNAVALTSLNSITYTRQVSGTAAAITASYATGIITSSPLDTAVTASATGSGAAPSVTSGTPAASGELFVGFTSAHTAGSNITYTQDTTHNWASPPNTVNRTGATMGSGSQINSGTGTIAYTPTIQASSWAAQIFGFKSTDASVNLGAVSGAGAVAGVTPEVDSALGAVSGTGAIAALTPSPSATLGAVSGAGVVAGTTAMIGPPFSAVSATGVVNGVAPGDSSGLGAVSGTGVVPSLTPEVDPSIAGVSGSGAVNGFIAETDFILPGVLGSGNVNSIVAEIDIFLSSVSGTGVVMPVTPLIVGGGANPIIYGTMVDTMRSPSGNPLTHPMLLR